MAGRPAYLAQTERTRLDFPVSAVDVALMGTLAAGAWWRPPRREARERAERALARVGLADRARVPFGELSGGERRRALLARSLVQDAQVLLLDEPLAGVDPASAELISSVFQALRGEGRTLLVSTHDVGSARSFDRVLCLNGRQVAFGPPGEVLGRETLEATYGQELIVLDDAGREPHRDRPAPPPLTMDFLDPLLDPLRSGIDRRALLEVALLGAVCGGLGFWVVVERLSYAAESLSHGLLPGLVLAALAGAPLLLGAVGGVAVAAVLIGVAARDPRIGPEAATGVVVTGLVGLGALLALTPDSPQRLEELLFGDPLGVSDSDLVAAAAARRRRRARALRAPPAARRHGLRRRGRRGARPPAAAACAWRCSGWWPPPWRWRCRASAPCSRSRCSWRPPLAVRRRARSAGRAIAGGAAVGAAGGVVGIYVSHHADMAAGATVALTLCLAAVLGSLATPRRAAARSGA